MYEYTLRELIDLLNAATASYDAGTPIMHDKYWDDLYFELQQREKETGIIYPDSPTQKIYFEKVSELPKAIHQYKPMLSLDKTKDPNEIQSFVKGHEWLGMFKLDGLSVRLTYVNNKLIKAETRGDGQVGEDITHNAKIIKNIPQVLTTKENYHNYKFDETIIIDGEIICNYEDFKSFENDYKNPRNFASGSIRLLDAKECARRNLTFIAWDLIKGIDEDFFAWRLEKLDEWGFDTVPRVCDAETIDDALEILRDMRTSLPYSSYPIDGYVFRFESQKEYENAGKTDHHFKGAFALKEYDKEYETNLKYIDYDVSRTGILTPVAVFEPVEIDGTQVERASLHNISVMEEVLGNTPYVGEKIWVQKANMIIPQIIKANKLDYGYIISHNGITTGLGGDYGVLCPVCGGFTSIYRSNTGVKILKCDNEKCPGKLAQQIDHYCGKKGLDIKGLSRKTIEKLIDWNWIDGIKDIYNLKEHKTEWESKTGFGKASVGKILDAIEQAGRHPKLESFISALGIPLVGTRVSKDIVKYYNTWEEFRDAIGGDWTEFEGFGPEISKALNKFDYAEADEIAAAMLTFSQPEVQVKEERNATAAGLTFCITGKLTSGNWKNRSELKSYIESIGGKVVDHMSSKVNYLITNSPNSGTQKNKDAIRLGVSIITEQDFIDKWLV